MTEDTERVRRGKQLNTIIAALRETGIVDAHQMNYQFGITRTAGYIAVLRKAGWDIATVRDADSHMATYVLKSTPASWVLTTPKRVAKPKASTGWACVACKTTALDLAALTPITRSFAKGECATCGKERMFRPLA